MNALRNSKKISLLAVAILFLFTFFNLILDAPGTYYPLSDVISVVVERSTVANQASQAGFTLILERIQAGCEVLELFSHLCEFTPVSQGK